MKHLTAFRVGLMSLMMVSGNIPTSWSQMLKKWVV